MAIPMESQSGHRRRPRAETTESWLIFALSFPICLAVAMGSRLSGRPQALAIPAGRRSSIVAEARAAASTCSSFAFMG